MFKINSKGIVKNSIDDNTYNTFTLSNGLRVITISDSKADKAGCALSVGVGSYDEPREIEGLAHFLEHMLFMGTEEYPKENEYSEFLNQHNGSSNAFTSNENTVYYFDVSLSHFEEALRMFSSFFKTPLFSEGAVNREISAVHSEFLNGKCNDNWRVYRMFQLVCKEELPESQFNVGNNTTLRVEDIHKIVKKFWEEKYSSDKMCLVLYSKEKEETYKKYIELFEGIRNSVDSNGDSNGDSNRDIKDNHLESNIVKDNHLDSKHHLHSSLENLSLNPLRNIFKEDLTNRIIKIDPIKDQKTLIISIVVPPEYKFLKTNPYVYIDHIFSKEDREGFIGRIKDKVWGFYSEFEIESYSEYSLLQISIGLTLKGVEQVESVLGMVEEYFSTFKYSEEEYWKIKDLKDLQFTYKEMDDPIDCVESISELMQFVPVENVFDYSYSLKEWNRKLLEFIISCISDRSKWIIFLLKKEEAFESLDELYNIKYTIT